VPNHCSAPPDYVVPPVWGDRLIKALKAVLRQFMRYDNALETELSLYRRSQGRGDSSDVPPRR
jgi:hypothetical protein